MSVSRPAPRRVVITGMGVICPLGSSPQALGQALTTGQSGIDRLTLIPTQFLPMSFGGEAREFTGAIENFGPLEAEQKKAIRKGLKTICREAQMGIAAAQHCLLDAGLGIGKFDPERTGAVFGSDYMISPPDEFADPIRNCLNERQQFDFSRWAGNGISRMNPLWLLKYLPNMPAAHLAIYNDLRGPNNSITQREASANLAIGEAFRYIARGSADIMIAGATGTYVHPTKSVQAILQQELASNGTEPAKASRPFDLNRSGMVLGEGAAAIMLEDLASAQVRGATILGEVVGAASGSVADRNFVADRQLALTNVMRGALRDAGATPAEVGHVHAHGLGTHTGDVEEAAAISAVFGAPDKQPPVAAAKSYFGNLGAGSGMVELISSLLTFATGELFPILNYETPDPKCPIRAARAGDKPGDSFLNPSVTQQGQASCIMVRAWR